MWSWSADVSSQTDYRNAAKAAPSVSRKQILVTQVASYAIIDACPEKVLQIKNSYFMWGGLSLTHPSGFPLNRVFQINNATSPTGHTRICGHLFAFPIKEWRGTHFLINLYCNVADNLRGICTKYHELIGTLEEQKYDVEFIVSVKALEARLFFYNHCVTLIVYLIRILWILLLIII